MKKLVLLSTLAALSVSPLASHAFGFGNIVGDAVKGAIQDAAKDATKEMGRDAAKTAAANAGIENADKYIDAAVDNSEALHNRAAGINASAHIANSGGSVGTFLGAANAAATAAEGAKALNVTEPSVANEYQAKYVEIHNNMAACGADIPCINKHQQELIELHNQHKAYVANSGDVNLDGKTDAVDAYIQANTAAAYEQLNK